MVIIVTIIIHYCNPRGDHLGFQWSMHHFLRCFELHLGWNAAPKPGEIHGDSSRLRIHLHMSPQRSSFFLVTMWINSFLSQKKRIFYPWFPWFILDCCQFKRNVFAKISQNPVLETSCSPCFNGHKSINRYPIYRQSRKHRHLPLCSKELVELCW